MFINSKDMTVNGYTFIEDSRIILPGEIVLSKYLNKDKIKQLVINNPLIDTYRMSDLMDVPIQTIPAYSMVSQYIDNIAAGIRTGSPYTDEIMDYINVITSITNRIVRDIGASVDRYLTLTRDKNSYLLDCECALLAKKVYTYLGIIYTINPQFDWDDFVFENAT